MGELCNYIVPDALLVVPTGAALAQTEAMDQMLQQLQHSSSIFEQETKVRMQITRGSSKTFNSVTRADSGLNLFISKEVCSLVPEMLFCWKFVAGGK